MSQGEKKVFLHLFPRLNALIKRLLNSSTSSPPRPASCHQFFSFHFSPSSTLTTSCLMALVSGRRAALLGIFGDLQSTFFYQPGTVHQSCSDIKGCFAAALFQEIKCNKIMIKKKQLSAKFNFQTPDQIFFSGGDESGEVSCYR